MAKAVTNEPIDPETKRALRVDDDEDDDDVDVDVVECGKDGLVATAVAAATVVGGDDDDSFLLLLLLDSLE